MSILTQDLGVVISVSTGFLMLPYTYCLAYVFTFKSPLEYKKKYLLR